MADYDPLRPGRVAVYYTYDHLTQREIGRIEGISAPAVCKILQKLGIRREEGEWCIAVCAHCHVSFRRQRAKFRKARRPCCSPACYYELRHNPSYRPWRHGQRIARETVKAAGAPMLPGCCVHHHDGNNRNNVLRNLAVFASQSDHLKYHHTGKPAPIWDGNRPLDAYR